MGFSRRATTYFVALVTIFASLAITASTKANDRVLPAPAGEVLLSVCGNVGRTSDGECARFDRVFLERLGMRKLVTGNPFVEGVQHYEGVLLADLLDKVEATGQTLVVKALDGYTVNVPLSDAREYPVLLALKWNGKVMRVRDKGPIWIVYPLDQYPHLNTETYSARSVWQLSSITVR
jgi:hypothetical protein